VQLDKISFLLAVLHDILYVLYDRSYSGSRLDVLCNLYFVSAWWLCILTWKQWLIAFALNQINQLVL